MQKHGNSFVPHCNLSPNRSWLVSSSLPLKSFHDLTLSYVVLSIFPLNSTPSLSSFISLPALVVIWFGGKFFVTLGMVSRYCRQSNPLSAFIQMPVGGKGLVVFLGLSGTVRGHPLKLIPITKSDAPAPTFYIPPHRRQIQEESR